MQGLLREMDKPARQVLIEVTVASVSLSDTGVGRGVGDAQRQFQ